MKKRCSSQALKDERRQEAGRGRRQWRASWREEIMFYQTLSQRKDWSMFGEPKKEKEKAMFGWNTEERLKRRGNKGLSTPEQCS